MVNRRLLSLAVFCLAVLATALQAVTGPTVFVLPNGQGGSNDLGTVFGADPFQTLTSVHADPAANFALETPSGSKYYVFSPSGSNTISAFDASLSTGTASKQINLNSQAKALALSATPSWVRLLVLTSDGFLHIIDTATDTEITRVSVGAGPADVAVSLDGLRAFVLAQGQVVGVDLGSSAVLSPILAIGGTPGGISVGPNGLVYAGATNQVQEIDGRTMTLRGTIPLNALPGKLVFTPDGTSALAINQTPVTGSAVVLMNLGTRTVTGVLQNFGPVMKKIVVASNSLAFLTSATNPVLYQLQIPSMTPSSPTSFSGVTDIAVSNEYASGTTTGAKFLYVATTGNTVYRVDPATIGISGTQVTSNAAGTLSYVTAGTTGTPATIIPYNSTQNVAVSAVSIPLVLRVLDVNGKPLYGTTVSFSTSFPGTIIQTPTATTNADGLAQTYVTAPATGGAVSVFGSAGGLSTIFTLNVGGTTPTGGGGTGAVAIQIVSGNGQLTQASATANLPLTVLVTDPAGNPLSGQTVTWIATASLGSGVTVTTPQSITDANGLATTSVIGPPAVNIPVLATNLQSIVTASIPTGSVSFYVTTLANIIIPNGTTPIVFPGAPTVSLLKPAQGNRSITGGAGQTILGAVQVLVTDFNGQALPNIGLSASTGLDPSLGPTASCKGGTVLTDSSGIANCDLVIGLKIGNAQLTATVGGQVTTVGINLTVTPGSPANINIVQGNNQSGNPGQTLPAALKAQVTDLSGNLLPGMPVRWTVASGSATLANVVATSDASGNVSALATLGQTPGAVAITVTNLTGSGSATFNLTVNLTLSGMQAVSGGGQTAMVGQPFSQPLAVTVADTKNNPSAGVTVNFAVTSGSATLSASSAVTGSNGQASVTATAGANAGPVVVTASVASFSATFSLTVIPLGPSITAAGFLNGAGFQQGVVPGSVVFIGGSGIAPNLNGSVVANSIVGPLPTSLAGVTVLFGSTPAPIYAVNNINGQQSVIVQVPFEAPVGSSPVTINVGGGTTTVNNVQVLQYQPGIFEETAADGHRYGVVMRSDGSFVSPANPAHPGETVQMFTTGLGQITPPGGTNKAGIGGQNVLAPVLVGLDAKGVTPISAQYAQNMIGVYVVTFQIPANVATGPTINLSLALGTNPGLVYSNSSTIPIQ